jgi:hypothetical protein
MIISRYLLIGAALATTAGPALAAHATLHANLRGQNEVPGPGKNNASGSATVRVNTASNQVCYSLSVSNLPRPTMAHIHRGRAGTSGPPVVTLHNPAGGASHGCTRVARGIARNLLSSPRGFYVNVHSQAFADGAIRGQLMR